jgi:hypothetical protein
VNGEWVENPNDFGGNLRPSANVMISVNPTVDTPAAYPEANSDCSPPQSGQVLGASTLVNTGTSMMNNILFGATILSVAIGITFATNKRSIAKK